MLVREKENQIIFFESPRKFTFFDIILVLFGVSVAGFCFYSLYKPFDDSPYRAFIWLGLLHVLLALYPFFDYFGAKHTVIFDYHFRKIIFDKKSYFGNSAKEYNFDQIKRFHITEDSHPDNPEGWNVEMELKTGEGIVIPHSFAREQKAFEQIVQTINNYLTKRT